MGTDIHGWVEVRDKELDELLEETNWRPVIDAGWLLRRDYTMFGTLFGVRNHTDFQPVASRRELPTDVSETVQSDAAGWSEGGHSHTWVSWQELEAVNWDEEALTGMAVLRREGAEHPHVGIYLERNDPRRREGQTWGEGGGRFVVEKLTRREAIGPECQMLFELMEVLARRYGNDCVRLVVWFDNYS